MEFPNGRWKQHNTYAKDRWVESAFRNWTKHRKRVEMNKTLEKAGINEYGDSGKVIKRFSKLPDCENSYYNYFCWINFPRWYSVYGLYVFMYVCIYITAYMYMYVSILLYECMYGLYTDFVQLLHKIFLTYDQCTYSPLNK